jgi:hypothetical protein
MPGSSFEIFQAMSDETYDVSKVKVEEDIDIKEDVKTEDIGNEEEKCIVIKEEEDDIHSEEEVKEDDIDTNGEEDVDGKVEVS